jgi:hypothetical protein
MHQNYFLKHYIEAVHFHGNNYSSNNAPNLAKLNVYIVFT